MTSVSIAEKLLCAISQGGVPEVIITDLAPNLTGTLISQVYRLMGIEKKQTFARSPKCLGQHERFHRTMTASLRCLLLSFNDKDVEWDSVLLVVEYSLRSSINAETHLSPM